MRTLGKILAGLVALAAAFGIGMFAVSELGGEIVTLTTRAPDGDSTTRLWVVDDAGFAWLRAGTPGNAWLQRIDVRGDVTVERDGVVAELRAVPVRDDPALRDRIHALMREKYGWADAIVSATRDGAQSVPVRLEPAPPSP